MKSISAFFGAFSNPYRASFLSLRGYMSAIILPLIVVGLFYIFNPFGINELAQSDKNSLYTKLFGITALVGVALQVLFPFILKDFYNEGKWTGNKQLVQYTLMIGLISFLGFYFIDKAVGSNAFMLRGGISTLVGILVMFFYTKIHQGNLAEKNVSKSEEINKVLGHKTFTHNNNGLQFVSFQDGGNKLSLIPNQLIYVDLNGSSPEFHFQNMIGTDKKSIAVSEAAILKELSPYSQFVKVSDNLIVNQIAIQGLSGHAGGIEMQIAKLQNKIFIGQKYSTVLDKLS